ncbi:MAG TPA: hypothetical protein P5084_05005 [Paludibacter sp.]|nr:hypothetical protein [Paludibacter sp.]
MASRRKLKKTINFVTSELITDIYFHCLMNKNIDEEKVENLVTEAVNISRDFILRAIRPDGKNNPQRVKFYYKKLFSDWQIATKSIIDKKEKL